MQAEGLASQERARAMWQGLLDPKHQETILYNNLEQRYFLRGMSYFQLSPDPVFFFFSFAPQLHVGDPFTSGKS